MYRLYIDYIDYIYREKSFIELKEGSTGTGYNPPLDVYGYSAGASL